MSQKIVYFTRYTQLGASSRLRMIQFIPAFEKAGFRVVVSPLFSEKYLERLYSKKSIVVIALLCYLRRFFSLHLIFSSQIVIIEKELFPYLPAWLEQLISKIGIKYIVDYDDAVFLNYEKNFPNSIKGLMKNKIKHVMQSAEVVVAGNSYLAAYAEKSNAKKIIIIPTVVDTDRYKPIIKDEYDERVKIGWIGSPSTLPYLKTIIPIIEQISESYPIVLQIVGAKMEYIGPLEIEFIPWSESTEISVIQKFDIGVMPLEQNEWALGKCAYKLIQYMACGVASIGADYGANKDVITDSKSGYLAVDAKDWHEKLKLLISNKELQKSFGKEGRNVVEKSYSLKHASSQWLKILKSNQFD